MLLGDATRTSSFIARAGEKKKEERDGNRKRIS